MRLVDGHPAGWEFRDDRAIFAEASARADALVRLGKKLPKPSAALVKKEVNVWVRLMWLSAMDGARKAERDAENERAGAEHAQQQAREPYQPPLQVATSASAVALAVGRSGGRRSAHAKQPGSHLLEVNSSSPLALGSAWSPPRACSLPDTPAASRATTPRAHVQDTTRSCCRTSLTSPQGSLFATLERAREMARPQALPTMLIGRCEQRPAPEPSADAC